VREDGRLVGGRKGYITGMEEAPENSKESSHSAYTIGIN
jgi:hypothetical protein